MLLPTLNLHQTPLTPAAEITMHVPQCGSSTSKFHHRSNVQTKNQGEKKGKERTERWGDEGAAPFHLLHNWEVRHLTALLVYAPMI